MCALACSVLRNLAMLMARTELVMLGVSTFARREMLCVTHIARPVVLSGAGRCAIEPGVHLGQMCN